MTKPDRFKQMVERVKGIEGREVINAYDAVTLLRRYHDAVVRVVKRERKLIPFMGPLKVESTGDEISRKSLLTALARLKKGTR